MRVQAEFGGNDLEQFLLDRNDVFSRRKAGTIGEAENVGIDRDGRFAKDDIEDDIRRLAPHAG